VGKKTGFSVSMVQISGITWLGREGNGVGGSGTFTRHRHGGGLLPPKIPNSEWSNQWRMKMKKT